MRDFEVGLDHDLTVVEDQIEIEGPRGVPGRTLTPAALFDREERLEKLAG